MLNHEILFTLFHKRTSLSWGDYYNVEITFTVEGSSEHHLSMGNGATPLEALEDAARWLRRDLTTMERERNDA